jgi:hypothetical protein
VRSGDERDDAERGDAGERRARPPCHAQHDGEDQRLSDGGQRHEGAGEIARAHGGGGVVGPRDGDGEEGRQRERGEAEAEIGAGHRQSEREDERQRDHRQPRGVEARGDGDAALGAAGEADGGQAQPVEQRGRERRRAEEDGRVAAELGRAQQGAERDAEGEIGRGVEEEDEGEQHPAGFRGRLSRPSRRRLRPACPPPKAGTAW